jgi:thiol-disulfide isomerase/thioredoxin
MTPRARLTISLGLLAALLLVAVVLYGRNTVSGNAGLQPCEASGAVAERLLPLAKGEIAALHIVRTPVTLPDITLETAQGPRKLSDFKGKTVLFNLWATWCVPCREEMPALDALQKTLGSADFEVVALNMDTRNPERVPKWLSDNRITALGLYTDPKGTAFQALRGVGKVTGLPTTFLLDRSSCAIAEMAGSAKWDSDEAQTLINVLKKS